MSEIKFMREKGDGDPPEQSDGFLVGYVYMNLSANVGDDQVGSFSGWVQLDVAERVKSALNVSGDVRPERVWF